MKSIADLKQELRDAKGDLNRAQSVTWGDGMVNFNDQLTKVTRLQAELNQRLSRRQSDGIWTTTP